MTSWKDSKLLYNLTPLLYEKSRCLNAAETYCMSKKSCLIFKVYSLYANGQELLDILLNELSTYGIESLYFSFFIAFSYCYTYLVILISLFFSILFLLYENALCVDATICT